MSELSEEEIIEEFKELIYNPDYDEILLCTEDGFTGWHELFENILDLYNKEKEKNKLLIEGKFREVADKNSYIKDNYISKAKIKEVIEEQYGTLCMELGSYERDNATSEQERIAGGINELSKLKKDLLEERN